MKNFREKYIKEYIQIIETKKKKCLNEWERQFMSTIINLAKTNISKITYSQFNKLKEIAEKY